MKGRSITHESPDFAAVTMALGFGQELEQNRLLSTTREALEKQLNIGTDVLLFKLAAWLEQVTNLPAAAGVACVSGNIYLGTQCNLGGKMLLSPEQTVVANIFSYGEIGLDALATSSPLDYLCGSLLQEIATFRRMRWLQHSCSGSLKPARSQKKIALSKHFPVFKDQPLMSDSVGVDVGDGNFCNT